MAAVIQQKTIPYEYICPVGGGLMLDPVIMTCLHVFDRVSISEWFRIGSCSTCPLCRADVVIREDALELKEQIVKFVHENPHLFEGKGYEQLVQERETQIQEQSVDLDPFFRVQLRGLFLPQPDARFTLDFLRINRENQAAIQRIIEEAFSRRENFIVEESQCCCQQ